MKVRRRDWGGRQDDGGMIKGWRNGWRREEAAGITTRTRWRAEGWTMQRGWMRVNGGMMEGGWWRLRRRQFQFYKLAASGTEGQSLEGGKDRWRRK